MRKLKGAVSLVLVWGASAAVQSAVRAEGEADIANAESDPAVVMQRYIVSATRIGKNPWRYGSFPGFEVLSRASEEDTYWLLSSYFYERMIEKALLPADWFPQPPVPYTIIIDDTNLGAAPGGQIHLHPLNFHSPEDALTWGKGSLWGDVSPYVSDDAVASGDGDTTAINSNLYGVDTHGQMFSNLGVNRISYCTPPLPNWLIAGLTGRNAGIFREAYIAAATADKPGIWTPGFANFHEVKGPGTLWKSVDETRQLLQKIKKDKKTKIALLPLGDLFAETLPSDESDPIWESEAALFVRWGLFGRPGHKDPAMSRAFLEFARRVRVEPVTEQMFAECFGFGYAAMEERLEGFLKEVLAQPTSVAMDSSLNFPRPELKEATADQIGRILGDWLRMKGDSLANNDPELSARFLTAAGQMLLRAYKDDNGLPPDVAPSSGGGRSADPSRNSAFGRPVAMKPFVVSASRLHDPGLLAVYGMYEHDTGDEAKAREFLEAAAKAGAVRPKALVALAQLRYSEASDKPLGAEDKLSAKQTSSIVEPLQTALQASPDPDLCSRIMDVWRESEGKPADRDIEELVEGVALYPRNTDLAYRAATFCARNGYETQAAGLLDKALVFTTNEDDRASLEELRSSLRPLPAIELK
jgi:hypothetical protein